MIAKPMALPIIIALPISFPARMMNIFCMLELLAPIDFNIPIMFVLFRTTIKSPAIREKQATKVISANITTIFVSSKSSHAKYDENSSVMVTIWKTELLPEV